MSAPFLTLQQLDQIHAVLNRVAGKEKMAMLLIIGRQAPDGEVGDMEFNCVTCCPLPVARALAESFLDGATPDALIEPE